MESQFCDPFLPHECFHVLLFQQSFSSSGSSSFSKRSILQPPLLHKHFTWLARLVQCLLFKHIYLQWRKGFGFGSSNFRHKRAVNRWEGLGGVWRGTGHEHMPHWWSCIITSEVGNSQAKEWKLLSSYLDFSACPKLYILPRPAPNSCPLLRPCRLPFLSSHVQKSPHPMSFPHLPPSRPPVQATTSSCMALNCTSLPRSPKSTHLQPATSPLPEWSRLDLPPALHSSWKPFERPSPLRKKKKKD